ncbi:MAG TPA: hypothetical protein DC049_03410 [Spirochaetia bacterium]|nr:hypothetical protein [Spirochaetia bacterium]
MLVFILLIINNVFLFPDTKYPSWLLFKRNINLPELISYSGTLIKLRPFELETGGIFAGFIGGFYAKAGINIPIIKNHKQFRIFFHSGYRYWILAITFGSTKSHYIVNQTGLEYDFKFSGKRIFPFIQLFGGLDYVIKGDTWSKKHRFAPNIGYALGIGF